MTDGEFKANSCLESENNVVFAVEETNLEDSGESLLSEICVGFSPTAIHDPCLSTCFVSQVLAFWMR